MTRKEAKELLPIIQAYADGRTILIKHDGDWFESCENTEIFFSESPSDYSIKPETKYRPFKNTDECWNEMQKHEPFGWLKSKKTGSVGLIGTLYTKDEVLKIIWATKELDSYSSFDVFNNYVFTDGEPFGINEE